MIRESFDKMDEFITKFEKKLADLIRCGIVVLAMQIIDAPNITDKEKQIVLTVIQRKIKCLISLKVHLRNFWVKEYL